VQFPARQALFVEIELGRRSNEKARPETLPLDAITNVRAQSVEPTVHDD
jgi:hypothetical protein